MTSLLEIREKVKQIYSKYEVVILPVLKFLLAFIALNSLNGKIGYMTRLDNVALVLIISMLCAFLSPGVLVFFGAVISLAHMYAVSMEVALVGLCVYLVMYLMFFRFSPKDALVLVMTMLLFNMKLGYVVPVAVGLVCAPSAIVSMVCGIGAYYFLEMVVVNVPNINTMKDGDIMGKIQLMVDTIITNRAMIVVIGVFVITTLTVYFLRRRSMNYAWTIAMVSGALLQVLLLLIGDLIFDINSSVGGALLGSLLAVAVGKLLEFFRFCVDYNRTEFVQFEDDEYYYYVKAVPKMTVAKTTRTVKRINEGRSVVTERTAGEEGQRTATRGNDHRAARSMTIGNTEENADNNASNDYEELF